MPIRRPPAWTVIVVAMTAMLCGAAIAQSPGSPSPLGLWQTVDDKTGKPAGLVRLYESGGKIFGKIEKSFRVGADEHSCVACTDERRNQPILGLVIIRSMERDGDEYRGGDILDPDNGSVYRCILQLQDGGRKLRVRGYLGISLLGRTQTWERISGEP